MKQFVFMVALVVLASGCRATTGQLVLTEDAVHDALVRVDDQVRVTCTGPNAAALKEVCSDVRTVLVPTLEAGAAFNRCVAAQKASCLAPLVITGGNLVTAVQKLPSGQSAQLAIDVAKAIAAAVAQVGGVK